MTFTSSSKCQRQLKIMICPRIPSRRDIGRVHRCVGMEAEVGKNRNAPVGGRAYDAEELADIRKRCVGEVVKNSTTGRSLEAVH